MATEAADLPQAVHEKIEAEDSNLVNETTNIATLNCKSEVETLKNAKEGNGKGENFLNLPSTAKVSAEANNGSPNAYEVMEKPDQTKKDACDIQSLQDEKLENPPVEIVATKETSSEEIQQNAVELSTGLDKVEDTALVRVESAVDLADATSELIVEDSAHSLEKPRESLGISEALHGLREDQRKDEENKVNDDCPMISKPDDIETQKMDKERDTTVALEATYDETVKICEEVNDDSKITITPDDIETRMLDKEYDTTILSEATSDRMSNICQEVNDDEEKTSNPDENEIQMIYREHDTTIPSEATTDETVKICHETTEPEVTHSSENIEWKKNLDFTNPLEAKDSHGPSIDAPVNKSNYLCSREGGDHANSLEDQDDSKASLEIAEENSKQPEIQATELEVAYSSENVEKLILLDENQHASVPSILDKKLADSSEGEKIIADIPSQEEEDCNQIPDVCTNNSTEIINAISEATNNFMVLTAGEKEPGFPCGEENRRKELDTEVNDDRQMTSKPDDIETQLLDKDHNITSISEATNDENIKICKEVNDDCQMTSKPDDIGTQMIDKEHDATILSEAPSNETMKIFHDADDDKKFTSKPDDIDNQLTDEEQNTTIQPEDTANETIEICQETTHEVTHSSESMDQEDLNFIHLPNEGKENDGPSIDAHVNKSSNLDQDNYEASHEVTEDQRKETESQLNDDHKVTNKPDDIGTQMMETEHNTTIQSEATADETIKVCQEMTELEDAHASEDVENIIQLDMNRNQHVFIECILKEKVAETSEGGKNIAEIPSQEEGDSDQVHDGCIDNLTQITGTNSEAKDNFTDFTAGEKETGFPCEEENERKEPDTEVIDDHQMTSKPHDIEMRMMDKEHNTTILSEAPSHEASSKPDDIETQLMETDHNTAIQPEATANETIEICQETTQNEVTHCSEDMEWKKDLNFTHPLEEGKENDGPSIDAHVNKSNNLCSRGRDHINCLEDQDNSEASREVTEDQNNGTESQLKDDQKVKNKPDDIETLIPKMEHDTTIQSEAKANETINFHETSELEDAHSSENIEKIILLNENMNQHVSVSSFLEEKVAESSEGQKDLADNPSQEDCNQVHDGCTDNSTKIINNSYEVKDKFSVLPPGAKETGVPCEEENKKKESDTEMGAFHQKLLNQRQQSQDIEQIKMETDDSKDYGTATLQENSAKERSQEDKGSKESTSVEAVLSTSEVSNVVVPAAAIAESKLDEKNVIISEEEVIISEQEVKNEEKKDTGEIFEAIHFLEDSKVKTLEHDEKSSTACTTQCSIPSEEEEISSKGCTDSAQDLSSVSEVSTESSADIIDTTKLTVTAETGDPNLKEIELQDKVHLDKNDLASEKLGVPTIKSDKKEVESTDIQSGDVSRNTLEVNLGESYNPSNEEQKLLPISVKETEDNNLENISIITDSSSAVKTSENTDTEKAVVGQVDAAKNSGHLLMEKPDTEKPALESKAEHGKRMGDLDIKSINYVIEKNLESSNDLTKKPTFTLEPVIELQVNKRNPENTITAVVNDGIKATEERNESIGGILISQQSLDSRVDTNDDGTEHRADDKQLIDSIKAAEKANKTDNATEQEEKIIEQDFESSQGEARCEKKIQLGDDDPINRAPNFNRIIIGSNVSEQVQQLENENVDDCKGKIDRQIEEEDSPKDAQMIAANDAAVYEEKGLDQSSIKNLDESLSDDTKEKITLDLVEDLNGEQKESLVTKLPEDEALENITILASVATEENSDDVKIVHEQSSFHDKTNTEDADILDEAITISSQENLEHVDPEKSTSLQVPYGENVESMQQEPIVTEEQQKNASEAISKEEGTLDSEDINLKQEESSIKKVLEDEKLANITSLAFVATEENRDNQIVLQPSSFHNKTDGEDEQVLDDSIKFLSKENLVEVHPQESTESQVLCGEEVEPMQQDPTTILKELEPQQGELEEAKCERDEIIVGEIIESSKKSTSVEIAKGLQSDMSQTHSVETSRAEDYSSVLKELAISSDELHVEKTEPIEDEEAKLQEKRDEEEEAGNQKRSVANVAIYEEKDLDSTSIKDQAEKSLDDDKEKISLDVTSNLDPREEESPVTKMSDDDKLTISLAYKTEENSESNSLHDKTNIKDLQVLEDSVACENEENIVQINQKESIDQFSSAEKMEFIEQNSGTVFEEKEKLPGNISEVASGAEVNCEEEKEIDKCEELMASSSSVALDEISNFNPFPGSRTEILQEDGLGILAHDTDSPREITLEDAPLCIASADVADDNQAMQKLGAATRTTLNEMVIADYEESSHVEDPSTKEKELAINKEVSHAEKIVPIDEKVIMPEEKGEQEEASNSKRSDSHALTTLGEERDTDVTGSVSQPAGENLNLKFEGEANKFDEKADSTPSTVMAKETSVEEICHTEKSTNPSDEVPEINQTYDLELEGREVESARDAEATVTLSQLETIEAQHGDIESSTVQQAEYNEVELVDDKRKAGLACKSNDQNIEELKSSEFPTSRSNNGEDSGKGIDKDYQKDFETKCEIAEAVIDDNITNNQIKDGDEAVEECKMGSPEKETIPERYQEDEEKQEDRKLQIEEATKSTNENEKVSENLEEAYVDENVSKHIAFENKPGEEPVSAKESMDGILQVKEEEKIVGGVITIVNNQEKVRESVDVDTGTEREVPNDEAKSSAVAFLENGKDRTVSNEDTRLHNKNINVSPSGDADVEELLGNEDVITEGAPKKLIHETIEGGEDNKEIFVQEKKDIERNDEKPSISESLGDAASQTMQDKHKHEFGVHKETINEVCISEEVQEEKKEQEMLSAREGEMNFDEANTSTRETGDETKKTYDQVEKPDFSSHGKDTSEISHSDGVLGIAKDNENCTESRVLEEISKSETYEATSPNESEEAITSMVNKDIQPVERDTDVITVDSEMQESKAGIAPSDVKKETIIQCREEAKADDDNKENAETSKFMECAISTSKIMQASVVQKVVAFGDQEPQHQLVKLQQLPHPPHSQDSEMGNTEEDGPMDLQRASNITGNVKQADTESFGAEGEIQKSTGLEQEETTCGQDRRTTDEIIESANKSPSTQIAKPSLSDLLEGSLKESSEMADHHTEGRESTSQKEDLKAEKTEEPKHEEETTDEEKDRREESNEQKTSDLGCEAPIMVDAGDMDVKVAHKKSHNILSGVGSKVKHSIAKVKKAITGKSSCPKPPSPKESEKF